MGSKLEDIARAIRQSDIDNGHADEGTELSSYFAPARAAVEALREPSEAMCQAPEMITFAWRTEEGVSADDIASCWRSMIDEVLK